jgi:hypothetical protein
MTNSNITFDTPFDYVPDRSMLLSDSGRSKTLELFIEYKWNPDNAIYTSKDEHYEFKGKTFYSLKKLYLDCCDPTEYVFANTFLLNYGHWDRVSQSIILRDKVEQWRKELALKLQAEGLRNCIQAVREGNLTMSKWLANQGWVQSISDQDAKTLKKLAKAREKDDALLGEYKEDLERLTKI